MMALLIRMRRHSSGAAGKAGLFVNSVLVYSADTLARKGLINPMRYKQRTLKKEEEKSSYLDRIRTAFNRYLTNVPFRRRLRSQGCGGHAAAVHG